MSRTARLQTACNLDLCDGWKSHGSQRSFLGHLRSPSWLHSMHLSSLRKQLEAIRYKKATLICLKNESLTPVTICRNPGYVEKWTSRNPLLPRPPVPLHTHIVTPHLLAELSPFLLILSIKQREPRLNAPMRPGNRTRTRKKDGGGALGQIVLWGKNCDGVGVGQHTSAEACLMGQPPGTSYAQEKADRVDKGFREC